MQKEIKLMIKQEDLEFVFNKLSRMIVKSRDNPEKAWYVRAINVYALMNFVVWDNEWQGIHDWVADLS